MKSRLRVVDRKKDPPATEQQLLADIEFFRCHLDDLERRVRALINAPKTAA